MNGGTQRIFVGLGLLVVVWIVVYWAWPAGEEPPLSYDDGPPPQAEPVEGMGERALVERSPEPLREPVELPPVLPRVVTEAPVETASGPEPAVGDRDEVAPAEPEAPRVVAPEFYDYTVRSGDTFERIAQRELGDRSLYNAIARANPLKDPRRLRPGDVIRIPRDPSNIQGRVEGAPRSAPAPRAAEYVVQPGDTLSEISTQFYGSSRHWELILRANGGTLSAPEDLRAGQTLVIPPPPGGG